MSQTNNHESTCHQGLLRWPMFRNLPRSIIFHSFKQQYNSGEVPTFELSHVIRWFVILIAFCDICHRFIQFDSNYITAYHSWLDLLILSSKSSLCLTVSELISKEDRTSETIQWQLRRCIRFESKQPSVIFDGFIIIRSLRIPRIAQRNLPLHIGERHRTGSVFERKAESIQKTVMAVSFLIRPSQNSSHMWIFRMLQLTTHFTRDFWSEDSLLSSQSPELWNSGSEEQGLRFYISPHTEKVGINSSLLQSRNPRWYWARQ